MGVPVRKSVGDLWALQELLFTTRPSLIIETGTFLGGSALYLAHLCDILGEGRILSIDSKSRDRLPIHSRITYLTDSSISDSCIATVRGVVRPTDVVLVILDSDHRYEHVLRELELYAPFVTPGSYLIVEDTFLNGHPVYDVGSGWGRGPKEAIEAFLEKRGGDFESQRFPERFLCTFHPGGYLRRSLEGKDSVPADRRE